MRARIQGNSYQRVRVRALRKQHRANENDQCRPGPCPDRVGDSNWHGPERQRKKEGGGVPANDIADGWNLLNPSDALRANVPNYLGNDRSCKVDVRHVFAFSESDAPVAIIALALSSRRRLT